MAITPEQFKDAMIEYKSVYLDELKDEEYCHMTMDDLMCETLRALGYGEGVDIFLETPKWYA